MTLEVLELFLALISIAIGIHQLHAQGNRSAARFFFSLGVLVLGVFAWTNFRQQSNPSVLNNTVSPTIAPSAKPIASPTNSYDSTVISMKDDGNFQEFLTNNKRLRELEKEMAELRTRVTNAAQSQSQIPYPEMLPPSFDCRRAKTDSERLICGDPTLSDADGRLGRAYRSLLKFVVGADRIRIRDTQRIWIRWRDDQLSTVCTPQGRVDMNCAMNLWEQRIQQLDRAILAVHK